ncbi:MAG: hypothetical protein EOM11_09910, partial [Erysipelotrichia bacterium]|nr:hypothetical protein [Erysipelotrichia bacterium]
MKVREYEIKYRDKLQFFKVYDKYINELRKIVDNVCDNKNEKRLHIGIVLVINNRLYLAPMTSNGKKYLLTNKKHRRIAYPIKNGELGFIRIGNMIPLA